MKEAIIAARYARAFFSLALEKGKSEERRRELERIAQASDDVPVMLRGLTDPYVDSTKKVRALEEIALSLKLSAETVCLLKLLVEKGRISLLTRVVDAYRALAEKHAGIAALQVTVADAALAEETVQKIQQIMQTFLGKRTRPEIAIDRSLLGGYIVRLDDVVYDSSVKGRLERMKQELVSS